MRRWLLVAVAFPLAAWLLERLADELAMRRGEGPVTRALRAPQKYRAARAARWRTRPHLPPGQDRDL